jgi:hypothetical protein
MGQKKETEGMEHITPSPCALSHHALPAFPRMEVQPTKPTDERGGHEPVFGVTF